MSLISQAAKRLKTLLISTAGAASVGFDAAASYAAGTVGAVLKSLSASATSLQSQIEGILDGATFTGPVVLPGNAAGPLQAVPLQQLNAAIASVPSTVAAYAPPFYNVRAVVELAPSSAAFTDLSGGVLQSSRGGWGNPSEASITVQAPGFVRVTATGIFCFDAAKTSTAIVRVKQNATYLNPEFEIMNGSGSQAVNLIIPVEIGDVIRVAVKAVGTVTSFGCQSISYEYFGPTA